MKSTELVSASYQSEAFKELGLNANAELLKAVGDFEAELARSSKLPRGSRKEMIGVRRSISVHLTRIANLLPEVSHDPVICSRLRSEFSKVRHAMALHQATWPIVAIEFGNADYLSSLSSMRDANRSFISLIRTSLDAQDFGELAAPGSKTTALLRASASNGARYSSSTKDEGSNSR